MVVREGMSDAVSIPYGSIRREGRENRLRHPKGVSIPYGSIRRGEGPVMQNSGNVFQFLMVRLEAHRPFPARMRPSVFQFLMVRLEAQLVDDILLGLDRFNSLWFD